FDRTMPEEINRIVTDSLADLLLCSEPAGVENLRREGTAAERVELVGNVMIDTLRRFHADALDRPLLKELGLLPGGYGVVTLHRPANVDDPTQLESLMGVLTSVAKQLPLVFSVHPRTAERLQRFGLRDRLADTGLVLLGPQGYVDFLCLTSQSKLIVTDSGGLQEEATALGVPCLTMRPNTERPITVDEGSSTLVGADCELLQSLVEAVMEGDYPVGARPTLWDGNAAHRIAAALARTFGLASRYRERRGTPIPLSA
ncbi:MAG: UDP-N-acetyl glucosamine 2-epimerase, partial [Planctomycetia bacterium]